MTTTIIKFDKLVRDKMLGIFVAEGVHANYRKVSGEEYWHYLKAKLMEETLELLRDRDGGVGELADILEVVDAMSMFHGITTTQLKEMVDEKYMKRGGFLEGVVLESIEVGRLWPSPEVKDA